MATIVEERYALALYELAREENKVAQMLEQLTLVRQAVQQAPEFLKMLQAPSIPLEDKKKVLQSVFDGKIDAYLLNFLMLITEKRRAGNFLGMQEAFKQRYYAEENICEVTAITAVPLAQDLQKKLLDKLEKTTGKKVILQTKVNASILGGIVLKLGNDQIDTSIKTRLIEIAQKMTQIIA